MDSCFDTAELVCEICSYCGPPELAKLGRTARLFDCALDFLWNNPVRGIGLFRLLQYFPSDLVALNQCYVLSLLRPIEPRDWERFNFYAKRMKYFHLDTGSIDSGVLETILFSAPSTGILPNLRQLTISCQALKHARSFLNCGLESLTLVSDFAFPGLVTAIAPFLRQVSTMCSSLAVFAHQSHDDAYSPFIPSSLGHLGAIGWLGLHRLSTDDLTILSCLPKLSDLSLGHIEDGTCPPYPNLPAFFSLKRLRVTGSAKQLLKLASYLSMCQMETLSITFPTQSTLEIGEVTRAFADRCERNTLQTLTVNFQIDHSQPIVTPNMNEATHFTSLSPLFDFPNIEEFNSSVFPELSLGDDFVASLARSWPRLTSLNILTEDLTYRQPRHRQPPATTLNSLALLAASCPRLTQLGIEFDPTKLEVLWHKEDIFMSANGARVTNRLLRVLNVGESPIAKAPHVAAYLCCIFPNLDFVGAHSKNKAMEWESHYSQWQVVNDMIPAMLAVREVGRAVGRLDSATKSIA